MPSMKPFLLIALLAVSALSSPVAQSDAASETGVDGADEDYSYQTQYDESPPSDVNYDNTEVAQPSNQPELADAPQCCDHLLVNGTGSSDKFYQYLMGSYYPYSGSEFEAYHSVDGTYYPVYAHDLTEDRSELGLGPRKSYMFYYKNADPTFDEQECPEGCWVIGMHDPTPGNFWYGKKYWHMPNYVSQCPDNLTEENRLLIDEEGQEDSVIVSCAPTEK
eukprot:maker-scaffold613_size124221-snap-gene-0.27 protein:Tk11735 transcript:maker-scaffold613_size124221-snap-gene-0.27-mRNA-1 annotation:"inad-like protein"